MKSCSNIILICFLLANSSASGHGVGRLFDIQVVNGQLVAQGYNNAGFDGLADVRPHFNSIHDHFNFIGSESQPLGITNLPSWDIGVLPGADISALVGYELTIELVGSGKWINVPEQDGSGMAQDFGIPELVSFSPKQLQANASDVIRVRYIGSGQEIDTLQLGGFQLSSNVEGVTPDLDFEFFIDNHNSTEIYFIEFKLSTNAPGIADSDTIYVIQSPDGIGPVQRMHFQSLYLETFLGSVIESQTLLGDINQDNSIDLLDVQPFVNLINLNGFQIEADINQDGTVDLLDVNPFVELLLSK